MTGPAFVLLTLSSQINKKGPVFISMQFARSHKKARWHLVLDGDEAVCGFHLSRLFILPAPPSKKLCKRCQWEIKQEARAAKNKRFRGRVHKTHIVEI